MGLHHTAIILPVSAALATCIAARARSEGNPPVRDEPATAKALARAAEEPEVADIPPPLAPLARLVGDEWRVTAQAGTSMFHTWHWGPGKHSLRRMTDGTGASGEPWRALAVMYWHPDRKQARMLGLSPFARGVWEGTIRFEGEVMNAAIDLYQILGRRELILRWAFDGPDKLHETLSEVTGPGGIVPMVDLNHVRSTPPDAARPRTVEGASKPSERLKALEPFLGHIWEGSGEWAAGDSFYTRSALEWVPLADGIYVRVLAPRKDGQPGHLLDAYVYHHTGAGVLRCLALSERGGVYEGDLTVLEGGSGALQLDLKGFEGDRVVTFLVQLEFESGATVHQRVWSLNEAARTLMLDIRHRSPEPKSDQLP